VTIKGIFGGCTRILAWCWHQLVWIVATCVLLAAITVLALRYFVLPNIESYREDIAQSVSKAAGQRVTIGKLTADWDGMRPRLNLGNIMVYDKAGRAALTLQRVDGTLSWLSAVVWRPQFHSLDFYEPVLDVRRNAAGVISVAGIEMGGDSKEGGLSDWILSQRDLEIHNAAIDWTDEQRAAPVLQLRQVNMQLLNRGERHRFGLKAIPPQAVAGPLDVRGDLVGKSIKQLAGWRGRLYAQLDFADIAAWRAWVPFPLEINRGTGAVRAWAVVRDQKLQEMTADVSLSNVRTRLDKDLPEVDLSALKGRAAWKQMPKSIDFSITQLGLTTAGNLSLKPMDISYKAVTDANGTPLTGEIKCNALDLAPVLSLADHLPIQAEIRKHIEALSPQGRVSDVVVKWEGALPAPAKYNARGRFENLVMTRHGSLPGVKGVNGTIDASEKGGTVQIKSGSMKLEMPDFFKAPIDLDSVSGQTTWTRDTRGLHLKLTDVAYANADLAGTLQGAYQSVADQPGIADFNGRLTRADARRVMRYMPLPVARGAREWMEKAFVAGTSNDVNFRVKGDLREFPFEGDKGGTFSVNAKVSGGVLHYGDEWPNIQHIDGDLSFRGRSMQMLARQATINTVRLSGVKAEIADMVQSRLVVTGDAEGATPDFLKFIATTPVAGYIDHFTEGMVGDGPGKLNLRMELPLHDLTKTRVSGGYQVTANRLVLDPAIPPLEQVTGKLEFSDAGVNVPMADAVFMGGPMTIAGTTQRDGTINMKLQGRVNPDTLRKDGPVWLSQIRGATDWTGTITVRKKAVGMVIESNLLGLTSTLPVPLAKTAGEALTMHFERHFSSHERDQVALTLGGTLSARMNRHTDGKRTFIDRGTVRLGGGAATEPERDGVYVSGSLRSLNIDTWQKMLGTLGMAGSGASASSSSSDLVYTLAGIDVKVGELEVFDRKFSELSVATTRTDAGTTRYTLLGHELEGTADWNPQGRGRLVARLQKLTIPPPTTASLSAAARNEQLAAKEAQQLPALDVVAENFQIGGKTLGKLELKATQQERDWRIDELRLSNADSILTADGVWQSWLTNPRTQVNVKWNVLDVGRTLTRLGYIDGVNRGMAEIGGNFSWNGGPQQIDYPSLSGKFAIHAVKGQFLKMEPGIGKLLGIISLQSIPRRLTLDFRDVFSDGFAFDEIVSEVNVDRGIAASEKFLITGPSAKVLMGGTVDLNRETQNLQVRVSPSISDGASIATAILGGPIAALAVFVVSKLAKDPLDNLVSFRYTVTGGWADPVVAKVVSSPVSPPAARSTE
jgi:uncharacterized protein (TIGR02099 family)